MKYRILYAKFITVELYEVEFFILESAVYLDRILNTLSGSFDIYRPYRIGTREYPAYGYFFSMNERYVAVRKAQLWAVRTYEHILFIQTDRCDLDTVKEARSLMEEYMEPELVRKKEKYPEKDHMLSDVTVVILSDQTPDAQTVRAIEGFRFGRSYLFTFRGRSEGHLICVDLEREKVISNRITRQMLNLYSKNFDANKVRQKEEVV